MGKRKVDPIDALPKQRPALTPEEEENEMIHLAVSAAKKQLREGTASSQVITHYLKLATAKERLEREKMELEKQLLVAKTEVLQASKKTEELYAEAIKAMREYSGKVTDDEDI